MSYSASTYGDEIADFYDGLHGDVEPRVIAALVELAGGGPALELGIGTGRLALPLSQRGVRVVGIDASAAMVAKLRGKPGGAAIPVTMGDFARVRLEEQFSLVYIALNTFFVLLSAEEQIQ